MPGLMFLGPRLKIARELWARLQTEQGFTYNAVSHTYPTKGFVVSIFPEKSFKKAEKDFTFDDLAEYFIDNLDFLIEMPGAHLGAWRDIEAGEVVLDIVIIVSTLAKAFKLGRLHGQKAVYDLGRREEIKVPKGTRKTNFGYRYVY